MRSNKDNDLIELLREALHRPHSRRQLLQNPALIGTIMKDIPARQWLFEQCQERGGTNSAAEVQRALEFIGDVIQHSSLTWQGGQISPEIYEEAYSRTWVWFRTNLHNYKPEKSSFSTWFNTKLKYCIRDVIDEWQKRRNREVHLNDEWTTMPAPADRESWSGNVDGWIAKVKAAKYLRKYRMQRAQHVNCQVLAIAILQAVKSYLVVDWTAIAKQFEVGVRPLRQFWQNHCIEPIKECLLN